MKTKVYMENEVYESISEAADILNVSRAEIIRRGWYAT